MGRNAIVIAHVCPLPKNKGNSARLLCLLDWLRAKGFRLTFVLQPLHVDYPESISELRTVVDELIVVPPETRLQRIRRRLASPIRTGQRALSIVLPAKRERGATASQRYVDLDALCWPTTMRAVASAARRWPPALVVSEFAFFTRCFDTVPASALKVVDTHEVFSRNTEQFQAAGVSATLMATRESERRALERADLVLAIQRDDAEYLKTLVPTKPVITVGHAYPEAHARSASPRRGVVMYVGSSNQYNRHGLEMFTASAWPRIREKYPEAMLDVVGEVGLSRGGSDAGIRFVGRVDDEELARLYQTAHVVVNPQVVGTGLKIKCVEALSAGCPLVVNRAGADGLRDGAGKAFLVADNWEQFAEHVVMLLRNDTVRLRLEAEAGRFAAERFSRSAVFAELERFLDQRLATA